MELEFVATATDAQRERLRGLVAAAEAGDGNAAVRVGDDYRLGQNGLRYSPRGAFSWYALGALAGDATGQSNVGVCYEAGFGCPVDPDRSLAWYRRAAARKLGVAAFNVGNCYEDGRGVPADDAEALAWYLIALERGWEPAAAKIARLAGAIPPGVRFEEVPGEGRLRRVEYAADAEQAEGDDGFARDVTDQSLGTILIVGDETGWGD